MKSNTLYTVSKYNKPIFAKRLFDGGGWTWNNNLYGDIDSKGGWFGLTKGANPFSKGNIAQVANSAGPALISAGANLVGGLANNAISGGLSSGAGSAISTLGSTAGTAIGAVNPVAGAIVNVGSQLVGGLINRGWGMSTNQETLNAANAGTEQLKGFNSNADSFDAVQGPQAVAGIQDPYKGGWFSSGKARRKNEELQRKRQEAQAWAYRSVDNNILNLQNDQLNNALANYSAYGGPLDFGGGALGLMQQNKYFDTIDKRTEAIAGKNSGYTRAKTFADGGLAATFMDEFGSDPIGAAIRYNRGLEALAAQEEVEKREAERELAYNDMQKRILDLETENQGLQALMSSYPSQATMMTAPSMPEIPETAEYDPTNIKNYLKVAEGFIPRAFTLGSEAAPSIGYGFYNIYPGTNKKIQANDVISREEAYSYLDAAIRNTEGILAGKVPNWDKMTPYQKDALIDLAYNAGPNASHFKKNSNLMRALENEDWEEAARHLETTTKDPNMKEGLLKRSNRRKNIFSSGDYGIKAFGGELGTNGTDFTNGLLYVDEGGSHETNPFEGVPMGIDENGIPNLVEEGETVYNNYVFSDRMKVPEFMMKDLGLPKSKKGVSFADASKKMAQESEQRPNDPLSKAGLEASLSRLVEIQETERMKKQAEEYTGLQQYACGGKMGRKYAGTGNRSQKLDLQYLITERFPYMDTVIPWRPNIDESKDITPVARASQYYMQKQAGIETPEQNGSSPKTYSTWMRYAPVIGAGALSLTDALGLTNKPDYSMADKIEAYANRAGYVPNIEYNPIGNYLRYEPMDRLFYSNQLQANARATDRLLANSSSPSRAASMLANGYNTTTALGDLYRKAEEYNLDQRQKVADFNRKTDMFNSQMGLEAAVANAKYRQAAAQMGLSGLAQAATLRDSIDARVGAAKTANLSNFLTSLGNIGRENAAFNMINSTSAASNGYWIDNKGRVHYTRKPA